MGGGREKKKWWASDVFSKGPPKSFLLKMGRKLGREKFEGK